MTRVKRGTISVKRRKNVLKMTKGYRFGRSTKERIAKEAIFHAGTYAFRDRKTNKRNFRALWTLRINAAVRELGMSYSKFINALHKADIGLDRKVLATLAKDHPETFSRVAKRVIV
jgi:large subunit ribosomal protein L20